MNSKGQTALWAYGVSGDLPIVVLRIGNMGHMETVKQMLTAHEYFRLKCLWMDLILLNEFGSSYEQPVQERLQELVAVSHARDLSGKPGGVYILQSTNIAQDDLNLIFAAARLVLNAEKGCIADQLNVEYKPYKALSLETRKIEYHIDGEQAVIPPNDLVYQNNLGGFSQDGKEYIIYLKKGESTPLPWSNIIANRDFGFLVTESGSGYTWYKNSRENKLTPWSNDPVSGIRLGSYIYTWMYDREYWTTTALPVRTNAAYLIRHGQGYSVFESFYYGIKSTQTMFVPVQAPIKIVRVSLETKRINQEIYPCFLCRVGTGVNREKMLDL